eukprot:352949-Chlamydomonas_euryale.AAC.1
MAKRKKGPKDGGGGGGSASSGGGGGGGGPKDAGACVPHADGNSHVGSVGGMDSIPGSAIAWVCIKRAQPMLASRGGGGGIITLLTTFAGTRRRSCGVAKGCAMMMMIPCPS